MRRAPGRDTRHGKGVRSSDRFLRDDAQRPEDPCRDRGRYPSDLSYDDQVDAEAQDGLLGNRNPRLHVDELLVALAIMAESDPVVEDAMRMIPRLRGSDVHSSVVISSVDEGVFKKLGMYVSTEPEHQTKCLFHWGD